MTAILLAVVAFAVSLLTLFTGFGLGTILLPAFAFFFPVQIAVASTAIVHGANNLFKVGLLYKQADRTVLTRFGIPAVLAAFIGAYLLSLLTEQDAILRWEFLGRTATVTPVNLVLALLILTFAIFELVPSLYSFRVTPRFLPLGGLLSGFFGGLSGHQGALRAAFLSPLGLTPGAFAGTQAMIGLVVDIARLAIYGVTFLSVGHRLDAAALPVDLILVAVVAALAGAMLGKRLLPSVTIGIVQKLTGGLLILVGVALGLGLTNQEAHDPLVIDQQGDHMNAPMADRKIDYIEFTSPDLIRIKKFYNEAFGWTFQDWGDDYVSFEDGRLAGGFRRGDVIGGSALVILYANDLEAMEAAVRKAGGAITVEIFSFPGGRRFHFTDPVGNELAVWSDKERKE